MEDWQKDVELRPQMRYKSIKGLVSVIVPTNNRSHMLKLAIDSILSQSYQNFEIIIIANGCTDDTVEIVKIFQDRDDRIKFYNVQDSIGGAEARNIGLENTKGEFIAFLDDDDEWHRQKLEVQLDIIKNNEYAIIGTNYITVSETKKKEIRFSKNIVWLEDLFYENNLGSFSFCLTKKEYILDAKIHSDLSANQDWDLWLTILSQTNLPAYVNETFLVDYRIHEVKISTNYEKIIDAQKKFIDYWKNLFTNNAIDYQTMRLSHYEIMANKKINRGYFLKIHNFIVILLKSPYRFALGKYYYYLFSPIIKSIYFGITR